MEKINQAILFFQKKDYATAQFLIKDVLSKDPKNFNALHLNALIYAINKNIKEATIYFERALKNFPNDKDVNFNYAKFLTDNQLYYLSIKYHQKVIELDPNNSAGYYHYAFSLMKLLKLIDAHFFIDKAILLSPNKSSYISLKGLIFLAEKKHCNALKFFNLAIKQEPNNAEFLLNKGLLFFDLQKYNRALDFYDRSIRIDPNYHDAWFNKATSLKFMSLFNESKKCLEKCIELMPNNLNTLLNLGNINEILNLNHEASECYQKALSINSNYLPASLNLANLEFKLKNYEQSLFYSNQIYKTNYRFNYSLGDYIFKKLSLCDHTNVKEAIVKLCNEPNLSNPFPILAVTDDPNLLFHAASDYCYQKKYGIGLKKNIGNKSAKSKVKIGYFSADFGDHPVNYLLDEVFELHNRDLLEIHAFSFKPLNLIQNKQTRPITATVDYAHDVSAMTDIEIVDFSKKIGIDIAIDLMGHTANSRMGIFAIGASRIQINYLGYAGSTGAKFYDYILADNYLIPDSNKNYYTEKIFNLPTCLLPRNTKLSPSINQIIQSPFPSSSIVFNCFNNSYKINPNILDVWASIFKRLGHCYFWFNFHSEIFKKNLLAEFLKRGVSQDYIYFAERLESISDHLSRYQNCDLFLDTFPYNGHTTTNDALWSGLPVVTCSGGSYASRVSGSLLCNLNLNDLITYSLRDYENKVIDLVSNKKNLREVKGRVLESRNEKVFDMRFYTENLDTFFLSL